MKSSEIADPSTDPLSLLFSGSYVVRSAEALRAFASTNSFEPTSRADTTVHEFIGDLSYRAYLESN